MRPQYLYAGFGLILVILLTGLIFRRSPAPPEGATQTHTQPVKPTVVTPKQAAELNAMATRLQTINTPDASPELKARIEHIRQDIDGALQQAAGEAASRYRAQRLARFPIRFRRDDTFGNFHMITEGTVSNNGRLDARTETNNHVKTAGACGLVAVWLLDAAGNNLGQFGGQKFCVDAVWALWGRPKQRFDTWQATIPPDALVAVESVSVLHGPEGKDPIALATENVNKARELKQAIDSLRQSSQQ